MYKTNNLTAYNDLDLQIVVLWVLQYAENIIHHLSPSLRFFLLSTLVWFQFNSYMELLALLKILYKSNYKKCDFVYIPNQ